MSYAYFQKGGYPLDLERGLYEAVVANIKNLKLQLCRHHINCRKI